MTDRAATQRLLFLLDVASREGRHLLVTTGRLLSEPVDESWVKELEQDEDTAERVDAFAARFARLQDTIGDKLVPELLENLLEEPGSALDNLNRIEKLGLLESVDDWVEARNLRNRLVHEYIQDAGQFADALNRARELVPLLVNTYNALNRYAETQSGLQAESWPEPISENSGR